MFSCDPTRGADASLPLPLGAIYVSSYFFILLNTAKYVSSYYCLYVLLRPDPRRRCLPRTASARCDMCVLLLLDMLLKNLILLYVCPHTIIYMFSCSVYVLPLLLGVCMCVFILLPCYILLHATMCVSTYYRVCALLLARLRRITARIDHSRVLTYADVC
jgi:hypothetical protein